ncbi:hypothetical protein [Actinomyces wuliandei]|uniref:variant leucine-rich repeat-containing protein n=1 Tax=Actinomyces wuliandei TaxID=2057743 RepID=UPI000FDAED14|nr:hypothetical protein [Actinomyces wuliandei]
MTSLTPPSPTAPPAPSDTQRAAAADPATPAGTLAVLAGNHPQLRELIGRNPACPPELRSWISRAQAGSGGSPDRRGPAGSRDQPYGQPHGAADGAHQAHGDGWQEVSWAPYGWEASDVGLGPDPFGSVLGDPLTGSPLYDVSVHDEGGQADPASRPAGT